MKRILFLLLFLPHLAFARPMCSDLFVPVETLSAGKIRFTQDFIGYLWSAMKVDIIKEKYTVWKKSNSKSSTKAYLQQKTAEAPIPAIRDVDGTIRITDRHNTFFSFVALNRFRSNFKVSVRIERDYTLLPPGEGREARMMESLIKDNLVNLQDNPNPSFKDLKKIPRRITDLKDHPVRSFMSLVLMSFELPLRGQDFRPHIHAQLARELIRQGLKIEKWAKAAKSKNIGRTVSHIMGSKQALEFMRRRVNPKLSDSRTEKVLALLEGSLKEGEPLDE